MSTSPALSIEARGDKKAAADLHALGERAADIRRLSEKVRGIYRRSNERRFGYQPWPPLADATIERKARLGLDPRPERSTGALHRALTSARARGQIDERRPTQFRFGTDLPYAIHQQGTRHQPTRDLIKLSDSERREIEKLISEFVAKGRA